MPQSRARRPRRPSGHDPIAVVDIGSNSGRVMVFRPEAGGHLHVLAGSRAALRLARGLDRTGRIPPEALERAFEALRDFRAIALGSGVRRIEAAGTSALRDAGNGPPFIRRVKRELGISQASAVNGPNGLSSKADGTLTRAPPVTATPGSVSCGMPVGTR